MTITLDITQDLKAELARHATAQGRDLEAYAATLLEKASHSPAVQEAVTRVDERVEAIERLKNFGRQHGLSLGGISLRELRDEARP